MKKILKFNWFLLYKSDHQKVSCFKAKRLNLEKICNIIQVLKQKVKNKSSHQKEEIFMKSYHFLKNRKNTIFHYTCCKTRSQKEVQKQKRKKKTGNGEKKNNISFDLLQNMSF